MQNYSDRNEMVRSLCKEGQIGAEIGVFTGDFSEILLSTSPKKLFLIDCWVKQEGEYTRDGNNNVVDGNLYSQVVQKFKDDPRVIIWRMFSDEACNHFTDNYFDWIYLDADHTYASAMKDLKNWLPKVKIGGLFLGHDYFTTDCIDVEAAVNKFFGKSNIDILTIENFAPSWGIIKKIKKRVLKYI